jgi:hypothetical protein
VSVLNLSMINNRGVGTDSFLGLVIGVSVLILSRINNRVVGTDSFYD